MTLPEKWSRVRFIRSVAGLDGISRGGSSACRRSSTSDQEPVQFNVQTHPREIYINLISKRSKLRKYISELKPLSMTSLDPTSTTPLWICHPPRLFLCIEKKSPKCITIVSRREHDRDWMPLNCLGSLSNIPPSPPQTHKTPISSASTQPSQNLPIFPAEKYTNISRRKKKKGL